MPQEYGKYEPTNEMWWADFDRYLVETYGPEKGFYKCILPQMQQARPHQPLAPSSPSPCRAQACGRPLRPARRRALLFRGL